MPSVSCSQGSVPTPARSLVTAGSSIDETLALITLKVDTFPLQRPAPDCSYRGWSSPKAAAVIREISGTASRTTTEPPRGRAEPSICPPWSGGEALLDWASAPSLGAGVADEFRASLRVPLHQFRSDTTCGSRGLPP